MRAEIRRYLDFFANGLGLIPGMAFRLGRIAALPTCDETLRNAKYRIPGGVGVADREVVCEKDAADAYAWQEKGDAALDGKFVPIGTDPNADRIYFWDDSAGAPGFLQASTGLTLSGTTLSVTDLAGLVLIDEDSVSAVASHSLAANVFSSAYENYRVVLTINAVNTGGTLTFRLRAAGADNSDATYYWSRFDVNDAAGTGGAGSAASDTSATINSVVSTGSWLSVSMDLYQPQAAKFTGWSIESGLRNSATTFVSSYGSGVFIATTQFDSLSLLASAGTVTGTVRVYGYRNTP